MTGWHTMPKDAQIVSVYIYTGIGRAPHISNNGIWRGSICTTWFDELTLEVFLTTVDTIKDGVAQRVLLHFYLEDFQMSPASRFLKVCGDLIIYIYVTSFIS